MRSIFWKIFLSFWLAMVLITATAVFTSFQVARGYSEVIDELDRREIVQQAKAAFEEGGVNGFESWLKRDALMPPDMTMYLIGQEGEDALDRAVPQRVERQWRRFQKRRKERQRRRRDGNNADRDSRSFEFRAPNGSAFRPIFGSVPPRLFGVLEIPRLGVMILFIGVLISAAVCFALSRYLARPVSRIAVAAQLLASGKLNSRVGASAYRADEIGVLAQQFDLMAEGLERSEASRRDLFRNISHELRSPLARINVALELASRAPGDVGRHLERIGREAEHMEQLVAQVLELVRAQQHQLGNAELVDLKEIIDPIARDAEFEGRPFNKKVSLVYLSNNVAVLGYPDLLSSAIENVMRNAIAHTETGTIVTVSVDVRGNTVTIKIADQGGGVPETELGRLFEPFYRQAENTRSGAGVGLAITAKGIELMGGKVSAFNQDTGGLCVEITLEQASEPVKE